MPLKPVQVKNAAQSNPITMCAYLGHFKQSKYLAMGHNSNGSAGAASNDALPPDDSPTLPSVLGVSSNLFRSGGDRVDTPENYYQPPSMVQQLLDQRPSGLDTAPAAPTTEVRDPGRSVQLNPLFNSNGHANLGNFLGDALKPIVKTI